MFKKLFLIFGVFSFLFGCSNSIQHEPLMKQEYEMALGAAICSAVKNLNESGSLNDEDKFKIEFEIAVKKAVEEIGYSEEEWLNAKKNFFTSTEHEKLVKMHFTWCLIGNSFAD